MATLATAPRTELGSMTTLQGIAPPGWAAWAGGAGDDQEQVPELIWPQSVKTYGVMQNDAQLHGLFAGATWPIRRYKWLIDRNGCEDKYVKALSADLGLDIKGDEPKPRPRTKRRFNFGAHMQDALRGLIYGHYFFEQVGEFTASDGLWHLRKLGARPPYTIEQIKTSDTGSLEWIKQSNRAEAPEIPVERMVAYVWDQEGANWAGRSMFRSVYRNWLLKDNILRVGAINIQRAGGVPYAVAPRDATPQQIKALDDLAQNFKVGETAGGALPFGAELKFAQAAGGDQAVNYVKLMNEEMARAFLMMFMQLGQTKTGSRALGESFIDWFSEAQETVAYWYRDTFNEHVIEDWVDWNIGEDAEFAPLLVCEPNPDGRIAVADLKALIDSGAIQVDEELEGFVRAAEGLPKRTEPRVKEIPAGQSQTTDPNAPASGDAGTPANAPASPVASGGERAVRAEATAGASLPARSLRRQPYDHELRANVDFAQLEGTYLSARDLLVMEVRMLQHGQIQQLHDAIVAADGNLELLSTLAADPLHAEVIAARLQSVAELGASQAYDEGSRQGKTDMVRADTAALAKQLRSRAGAVDAVISRDLSDAASRKAVQLTGGALSPAEVAAEVTTHLRGLSDSYLNDQLGGAINAALNTGRKATINRNDPADIYASELLDSNTCVPCVNRDGTHYASMEEAERDYPTGGYMGCLGSNRCRGTLVAVYAAEAAPTLEVPGA